MTNDIIVLAELRWFSVRIAYVPFVVNITSASAVLIFTHPERKKAKQNQKWEILNTKKNLNPKKGPKKLKQKQKPSKSQPYSQDLYIICFVVSVIVCRRL